MATKRITDKERLDYVLNNVDSIDRELSGHWSLTHLVGSKWEDAFGKGIRCAIDNAIRAALRQESNRKGKR